MRRSSIFASIVSLVFLAGAASAAELSTSVMSPTPVGESGVVENAFPEGKKSFYVSVDVQPGDLLTQIGFEGRPGANKAVDLALLDKDGRRADSYWTHGETPAEEKTKSFPIDASGKQTLRIEVEGPPTAKFRVELGGSAIRNGGPKAGPPSGLSRSVFAPTPVAADGVITGTLPGPEKRAIYYVKLPVQPGNLLTQISVQSREGAGKSLSLELLQADARTGESYWVHGEAPTEEKTRSFPIDASGEQVIRLVTEGPETGSFKVEIGGSAVAPQKSADAGATLLAKPAS
jgi:hypothetical protein